MNKTLDNLLAANAPVFILIVVAHEQMLTKLHVATGEIQINRNN
jgi:hypothetical protein